MRRFLLSMAFVALAAFGVMTNVGTGHAQTQQSAVAQFPTGKWEGAWTNVNDTREVLSATLEIQSINQTDGKLIAAGVSTWGDAAEWNVKAGSLTFKKGEINGTKLVIGTKQVLEFELQPDGSLKGQRFIDGKSTGKITMRKTATSAAKN